MSHQIILALLFICGKPLIINETGIWTDQDDRLVKRAKLVCRKKYNLCLKVLKKKKDGIYHATCGRSRLTPHRH